MNRGTTVVNSLAKTVARQSRGCDLNPGPSVPESSTLTTRLPSHPRGNTAAKTIDVKTFLRFFLFWTHFYVFTVFLFSKRFLILKKRWQSSERQENQQEALSK